MELYNDIQRDKRWATGEDILSIIGLKVGWLGAIMGGKSVLGGGISLGEGEVAKARLGFVGSILPTSSLTYNWYTSRNAIQPGQQLTGNWNIWDEYIYRSITGSQSPLSLEYNNGNGGSGSGGGFTLPDMCIGEGCP